MLKLPVKNRLLFPATAPALDLTHPAAANLRCAATSMGPSFIGLYPERRPSSLGGVSGVVDGLLGPASKTTDGFSSSIKLGGMPAVQDDVMTFGVIVSFSSLPSGIKYLCSSSSTGSQGFGLLMDSSGNVFGIAFGGANPETSALLTLPVGTYFLAVSFNASSACNLVARNLLTGKILSKANGSFGTYTGTASDGTHHVGCGNGALSFGGNFAAFISAAQFMSVPQLLQWALDPWAPWYPLNDNQFLSPPAGGATSGALSSAGMGAAAWIGAANDASVVSSAGVGAVSWVSSAIDAAVLSSAGVGAANWAGNSVAGGGALSSAGTGAASWVSAAISAAALNAAGTGTLNASPPVASNMTVAMAGVGSAQFRSAVNAGTTTGFEYPPGYGRYASHDRNPKSWINDGFVEEPDY